MNAPLIADLVARLIFSGVALGILSATALFALRRYSVNWRVLVYTFVLAAHALLFALISIEHLQTLPQTQDSPEYHSTESIVTEAPLAFPSKEPKETSTGYSHANRPLEISVSSQSFPFLEFPASFTIPLFIFGAIWGTGILFLFSYWIIQALRLRKILQTATPITSEVLHPIQNAQILLTQSKNTAFCGGVFRPFVVIPENLFEKLSADEQTLIIHHEMAHLRAGDQYLIHLQFFAAALFWWLPTVWMLGQRLVTACEHRCDSQVLQAGVPSKHYAELLLKAASLPFSPPLRNGLPISRKFSETKKRIVKILMNPTPHTPITPLQKWITVAITAFIIVSFFYYMRGAG